MLVHDYFVNAYVATGANGVNAFEKDTVHHVVMNLEPTIKSELMSMDRNHLSPTVSMPVPRLRRLASY